MEQVPSISHCAISRSNCGGPETDEDHNEDTNRNESSSETGYANQKSKERTGPREEDIGSIIQITLGAAGAGAIASPGENGGTEGRRDNVNGIEGSDATQVCTP